MSVVMTMPDDRPAGDVAAQKRALDRRLDAIGWGLFFIMIGASWLAPETWIPEDKGFPAAAIGVGAILLLVNFARSLYAIRPKGGAVVIGIVALTYGISSFYGVDLPIFAILFILIGAAIILFPRRRSWPCGSD